MKYIHLPEREKERKNIYAYESYMWMTPLASLLDCMYNWAVGHKPREDFSFSYEGKKPTGIPDGETILSPLNKYTFFF
jgi:hypothetical protein